MRAVLLPRGTVALLALAPSLLLIACGGDEKDKARGVAEEYVAAYVDADAAKVCELSTEQAARSLAENVGSRSCEQGVSRNTFTGIEPRQLRGADVQRVTLRGERTAFVRLRTAAFKRPPYFQVELEREGEEWKVKGPFGD